MSEHDPQAMKEIAKTDWMPVNPCEGCECWLTSLKVCTQNKTDCEPIVLYQSNREAITKLLEWLIAHFWSKDTEAQNILKEMRKQLEEASHE